MPDHQECDAKINQIASDLSGVTSKVEQLVRLVYVGDEVGDKSILNRLTKIEVAHEASRERRASDKQIKFMFWGAIAAFVSALLLMIVQYAIHVGDAAGQAVKP